MKPMDERVKHAVFSVLEANLSFEEAVTALVELAMAEPETVLLILGRAHVRRTVDRYEGET